MPEESQFPILSPLVDAWLEKITRAEESRRPFMEVAEQCDSFFRMHSGFMWKPKFKSKFLGKIPAPRFEVTIAKAFELVALFGPTLFWRYPKRYPVVQQPIEMPPGLFGDPNDPQAAQIEQQLAQGRQQHQLVANVRSQLVDRYLNYSQREQPGGGLAMHGELAITDALVKGRGCLWVQGYEYPGSGRKLTGCFFDRVENLFIDPDCEDSTLRDAYWIAKRHVTPAWKLEQMFGYPRGYLAKLAHMESVDSQASRRSTSDMVHRKNGKTHDLVVWYEIWSKGGVGTRMLHNGDPITNISEDVAKAFDDVVGDYAYLCIMKGLPHPLNVSTEAIFDASDEDVEQAFEWRAPDHGPPFPVYMDDAWPVCCLDFYRIPGSPWPLAPMAPGLGELIALNILTSSFLEQAYENRKTILAYLESAAQSVKDALDSTDNPALVPLNDSVHKNINEIVQFLKRPEMNADIIKAIDWVSELFDKRTGLTEILYAMNAGGVQSRTARDVAAKEEKASIRPDYMAKKVAEWMGEAANKEKVLASMIVKGEDVRALVGDDGAYLWDQYVAGENLEAIVREMTVTVEANDVKKPNKQREAESVQQLLGYMGPLLQQYAQDTGDSEPVNAIVESIGDAIEVDVSRLRLGPWTPQANPEAQQAAQLELQEQQADVEKTQIEAQIKQLELQLKALELQSGGMEVEQQQQELEFDEASHGQELRQSHEAHLLDIFQKRQEGQLKIEQQREQGMLKLAQARQQGAIKTLQTVQDGQIKAQQAKQQGDIQTQQAKKQGDIQAKQAKQQGDVKVQQAKKLAAAKPKPAGGNGSKR